MTEEVLSHFFRAFFVGGLICLAGQLLFDLANLTPAHTMSILVTLGSVLGVLGLYPKLTEFAGFGATLPIVNFGSLLVEGAKAGAAQGGFIGLFTGLMKQVSAGIGGAVIFGFIIALVFKPKS